MTVSPRLGYGPLIEDALRGVRFRRVLKADAWNEANNQTPITDYVRPPEALRLVELDPDVVAEARRRHPGLSVQVADIRALPFPPAAFGAVIDLSTIDHGPDPQRAIREYARVLRRDGLLLLVSWVVLGAKSTREPSLRGGSQYFVAVATLRRALCEAGFRIVDGRMLTPEMTDPRYGHQVRGMDLHAYICRRV